MSDRLDDDGLDAALDLLPQYPASAARRRGLRARLPPERPRRRWPVITAALSACAAAVLLFLALPRGGNPLVDEAVADHLRTVYREHPVDVEGGGPHQVKPWFTGRL